MNIISLTGICMDALFLCLLSLCTYTDLKRREIPNTAIIIMLLLGIAHTIISASVNGTWWVYPAGLIAGVPFLLAWIKNHMGAGDVKLVFAISLYLGVFNLFIAFATMLVIMICIAVIQLIKQKNLKQLIPFAPVMAAGCAIAIFTNILISII